MLIESSEATYHQTIDNYHTGRHLENARKQAEQRGLDDVLIIDVDCHHYETDNLLPIIERIEDPALRQSALNMYKYRGASAVLIDQPGYQDGGGRIARYLGRKVENIPNAPGVQRDLQQAYRWMDALSVDYACLFPTPMLFLGLHPQVEIEVNMAKAYNSWMVEEVLAGNSRLRSMLYLPFNDPEATYEMVKKYAGTKGVIGFMVVSTRYRPIYHNDYMKTYALLEEAGLPISFHASYSWSDPLTSMTNRFITAHAVGFTFFNAVHCANWVINGLPERFPKLKVIWIESGLAWIPWLMQRLDHDFRMRTSECPSLRRLPSEYMREMFYTSQPMEMVNNREALELTFKMINAESQLLYSSDYPHWDMDLPSVIWDLPFLSDHARRQILGGNAKKLFNIDTSDRFPASTENVAVATR
ncbi:amidohydrolase family protein [Burkholderia ubonensis]|uniref:amidohydrolase family protein n=1 Tax=Burkholderia ubonensis TaxID=101571 RepID=UPI000BA51F5D|nr:amidohydrolase family protein [Burkholderia ubonensis]PAJ85359.1 amidohydrolase [Burkholderia ubonensis]PAJ92305.1 amidohydrolase [Burkholderia ubonensis]PAK05661.1 amidohydrolase [Burkholderia ubonensis]PAK14490.1 amidohydrolase [Burkholderia ubonensis]RQP67656.1 amidohydrolase [Burkholderia ubonensis]